MKARRVKPVVVTPGDLSLDDASLAPRVRITRQFVPEVKGNCEMLTGDSPAALADSLIEKLKADSII